MAVAALVLGLAGGFEPVSAAPAFQQCSQRYFSAHAACMKAQRQRVLRHGDRKAVCMRTGCWRTTNTNRCGFSRL